MSGLLLTTDVSNACPLFGSGPRGDIANTNPRNLRPLFHPAAHYASPEDVQNDKVLTAPEKRIILSSWHPTCSRSNPAPALREIPGLGHTIRLADILAALRKLDGDDDDPPQGGGMPMRLRRP